MYANNKAANKLRSSLPFNIATQPEISYSLGLHRISAPASASPKFVHFPQIRPSPAPAKFLAVFGRH